MTISPDTKGVYVIATTPFHEDGALDLPSVDRLTDFYEASGASGITVLGIMGEAPKLEPEESRTIVRRVVGRTRLPIVVGVSAPGFASIRALARDAMEIGAAGVMIAPPPSLRTDEQIIGYFAQAVEAIGPDVPFVLQDYPLMLSVVISPSVIATIMNNHPSCAMLKHEDWPGLEKITKLRAMQAAGEVRRFPILCGNGGLFLDFELERGADGAMTGYGFPEMLVELLRLVKAGQRDKAHDLFNAHLPLMRYEHQAGIGLAVRKHVLVKRGLITSDFQRNPRIPLSPTARNEVDYLLSRIPN